MQKLQKIFLIQIFKIRAYQHRAVKLVADTAKYLQVQVEKGKSFEDAWNGAQVEAYRISKAHCFYILVLSFINTLTEVKQTAPELLQVLTKLSNLFSLYYIEQDISEFLEDGYFSGKQAQMLREKVRDLLEEVRKDAVPLVDSLDISDYSLRSALGCYNGDYINNLYQWVQMEPANKVEVTEGYQEFLKPLMLFGRKHSSSKL